MFQHKDYTVTRLGAAHIQVVGKNRKAHIIVALKGDTGTPNCPCKVMGTCGHQLAAVEFLKAEAQPQSQPKAQPTLEELFAW